MTAEIDVDQLPQVYPQGFGLFLRWASTDSDIRFLSKQHKNAGTSVPERNFVDARGEKLLKSYTGPNRDITLPIQALESGKPRRVSPKSCPIW